MRNYGWEAFNEWQDYHGLQTRRRASDSASSKPMGKALNWQKQATRNRPNLQSCFMDFLN